MNTIRCYFCNNEAEFGFMFHTMPTYGNIIKCTNCGDYSINDNKVCALIDAEYSDKKHIIAGFLYQTKKDRESEKLKELPSFDERKAQLEITAEKLADIISDSTAYKTTTQKLDMLLLLLYRGNEYFGQVQSMDCFACNPYAVYAANDEELFALMKELSDRNCLIPAIPDAGEQITHFKLTTNGLELAKALDEAILNNAVVKRQTGSLSRKFNSDYMKAQIDTMYESIESKPHDAIGKAKELLEDCCKTILVAKGTTVDKDWDVIRLAKETCTVLQLTPNSVDNATKASDIIKALLGHHAAIAHSIAELRNAYGSGHGKGDGFQGLSSRHARLAVGSASTAVQFIWETYEEQKGVK